MCFLLAFTYSEEQFKIDLMLMHNFFVKLLATSCFRPVLVVFTGASFNYLLLFESNIVKANEFYKNYV